MGGLPKDCPAGACIQFAMEGNMEAIPPAVGSHPLELDVTAPG